MKEQQWLTSTEPGPMLDFVRGNTVQRLFRAAGILPRPASARKLELFDCACCRSVKRLLGRKERRRAVELVEGHADGLIRAAELRGLPGAGENALEFVRQMAAIALREHYRLSIFPDKAPAFPSPALVVQYSIPAPGSMLRVAPADLCRLLRHIVGNPFRPYPAPAGWPLVVIELAEAVYAGTECAF